MWESLTGSIADANGDVKVINAALRERFARFEVHPGPRVVPVLRAEVLWSAARQNVDEYPHKLYASQPAPLEPGELSLPALASASHAF